MSSYIVTSFEGSLAQTQPGVIPPTVTILHEGNNYLDAVALAKYHWRKTHLSIYIRRGPDQYSGTLLHQVAPIDVRRPELGAMCENFYSDSGAPHKQAII